MTKKVLIVALNKHWVGISRLPSGLNRAGFTTYALCPDDSYIAHTKHLKESIQYPTFSYSRSKVIYLMAVYAILRFKPDLIIPGDEEAILVLQGLSKFFARIPGCGRIASLLRSAMARPEFDSMTFSKSRFVDNCQKWGVHVPRSIKVQDASEAQKAANELGYPVVLKMDSGYGGAGVFICENEAELLGNISAKQKPSTVARLKGFVKNLLFVSVLDREPQISVQQFVKGLPGHISFAAVNGKLLGANPMLAIKTYPGNTGPSCVSQGFNSELLVSYARTVVEKIGYTGFGSLDFMFDDLADKIYVLELNSRPTPPCHLSTEVVTHDLCRNLYKALHNEPLEERSFKPYTVAMFPNETKRDPKSAYLQTAHHDVPVDDPRLVTALLNS